MEKRTKTWIFPTKKEHFHHYFQQICPHLGQHSCGGKNIVRFWKINLQNTSSLLNYFLQCGLMLKENLQTHPNPLWNIAFQGFFLLKVPQIFPRKNKIISLKNLKNTYWRWVFCKEHKGIKNARNIAATEQKTDSTNANSTISNWTNIHRIASRWPRGCVGLSSGDARV